MSGTIAPAPKHQYFTDNGDPASGYLLFSYEAGTTNLLSTYSDVDLTVPNTNPLVLDAAGRATIFLTAASYKFSLALPTDIVCATPIWTVDGVQGAPSSIQNIDLAGIAGEALAAGDVAYMADGSGSGDIGGNWYLATSDHNYASTDAPTLGIVITGAGIGNSATIRTNGRAVLGGALSKGSVYFIDATPGDLNTSDLQQNRCPFAQADSTTSVIFPISGTVSISIKNALGTVAYGGAAIAGTNGNSAGGADTELTGYQISVPDNFLAGPGDALVIEGTLALENNGNAKSMKVSIGGSGALTVFASSAAVATHRAHFHLILVRRESDTAALEGYTPHGAAQADTATVYVANHLLSGTIDWTIQQDLKFFLIGTLDNDIWLTDLYCHQIRSPYGVTV